MKSAFCLQGIRKHLKVLKPDELDPSAMTEGSTGNFPGDDDDAESDDVDDALLGNVEEDCDCNSIRADK